MNRIKTGEYKIQIIQNKHFIDQTESIHTLSTSKITQGGLATHFSMKI